MNAISPDTSQKYDLSFARFVRDNVEGGDKMNMCMQCGVCSGSCPIGAEMEHGPRKLFMMVRAGMKDAVLNSNSWTNCVSCYNCVVRCPREVPVKYILHGLGRLAVAEGYVKPKELVNTRFAKAFWWSLEKYGKTDERLVTAKYYFSGGIGEGFKKSMANIKTAIGMVKTGRMHLGLSHRTKKQKEIKAILAKAKEIQDRKAGEQ